MGHVSLQASTLQAPTLLGLWRAVSSQVYQYTVTQHIGNYLQHRTTPSHVYPARAPYDDRDRDLWNRRHA